MTDWRAAGLLANAHRVIGLARGSYDSPAKERVRTRALRFIAGGLDADEKMGDLWGGGRSARGAVTMGLHVISIEDGRWLKSEHRVSSLVAKRALAVDAEEGGFEWRWGCADKYAAECQGSFWDFCGHWCGDKRRTLKASDHHKRIVVTLMPERAPVGHGLTPDEWRAVYRGLLCLTLPNHGIRYFQKYRRAADQWAFVFGLERTGRAVRRAARRADPAVRARQAAYTAAHDATRSAAAAARRPPCANCGGPKQSSSGTHCSRPECHAARCVKYSSDPAVRARRAEVARAAAAARRPPCANCGGPKQSARGVYCSRPGCARVGQSAQQRVRYARKKAALAALKGEAA